MVDEAGQALRAIRKYLSFAADWTHWPIDDFATSIPETMWKRISAHTLPTTLFQQLGIRKKFTIVCANVQKEATRLIVEERPDPIISTILSVESWLGMVPLESSLMRKIPMQNTVAITIGIGKR
jgi:hypothetical protein